METKILVNKAATGAAILGLISGGYALLSPALSSSTATALLSIPLWAAKFVACIYVMKHCMTKLCDEFPKAESYDTKKLGVFMALFSAIITAACTYISFEFVYPDAIAQSMDQVWQMYGNLLDDNSRTVLEKMEGIMPQVQFFSTLFWCVIYGSILAAILSSRIPGNDPFRNVDDSDEQEMESED